MAIDFSQFRRKNIFDPKTSRSVSPLDPYFGEGMNEDPTPFISPTGPTIKASELEMNALPPHKGMEPTDDFKTYLEQLNKLYTPETQASDRFNRLMDSPPQMDEDPSIMRRIAASAAGVGNIRMNRPGGIEESEKVLQAPYLKDMADWREKAEPFSKAAQLENTANVNARQLAGNFLTNQTAQRKIDETSRIADEKNRISSIRADAYAYKNHGWKIMVAGDRLVAVNPNPPHDRRDLGESGGMDRRELENLQGEWDVMAQEARGEAERGNINTRGQNLYEMKDGSLWRLNDDNTWIQLKPPGTEAARVGTDRPETGAKTNTAESRRIINDKLQATFQTDPANKKYVRSMGAGKYDFRDRPILGATVPGSTTFGFGGTKITQEDVDAYDEFRAGIDPSYTPPVTTGAVGATGATGVTGEAGTQSQTLRFTDPKTGRTGTIPNTKEAIEAAAKAGYRVETGRK